LSEGQRTVAKVIRVDREKGVVDISLRRVNDQEKRAKLELVKRETRAERLLDFVLRKNRIFGRAATKIKKQVVEEFGGFYPFLEIINEEGVERALDVGIPERALPLLKEQVEKAVKKRKVEVKRKMKLVIYEKSGIDKLKNVLGKIDKMRGKVIYLGAPFYEIRMESEDYKKAEKELRKVEEEVKKIVGKMDAEIEFQKE